MIDYDVGDLVVCINDDFSLKGRRPDRTYPVAGQVYRVRGFLFDLLGFAIDNEPDGAYLDEILNPGHVPYRGWIDDVLFEKTDKELEMCFYVWRFRKCRPTSIEELKDILLKTPKDAEPDDDGIPHVRELEEA